MSSPLRIAALLGLASSASAQGTTDLVSHTSLGTDPGSGNSGWPEASHDGRFVAFESEANNLVPGVSFNLRRCFLADRLLGTVELVDQGPGGVPASAYSQRPQPSGDGAFVLFASAAPELGGFGGSSWDVFLRDRAQGTYVCLSSTPTDGRYQGYAARMSSDARFVALALEDGTVPGFALEIWLLDRVSGLRRRASETSAGLAANGACEDPDVSDDGRFVAFRSEAQNLVPGDSNGLADLFVKDMLTGAIERVNVSATAAEATDDSYVPRLSADGRFASFVSLATNLWPSGHPGVFVRDRVAGTLELVSISGEGVPANRVSSDASISTDGRVVVFRTSATNLSDEPDDQRNDCFLHDRATGATRCVSTLSGVPIPGDTGQCAVSGDGRTFVFLALLGTPERAQILAHDPTLGPVRSLCEGSNQVCPCANGGAPGSGCENSGGSGGALLASSGNPSALNDTWNLAVTGLPNGVAVLFYQGTAALGAGNDGQHFGDGLRCAGGSMRRLALRTASGGVAALGPGSGDAGLSVLGMLSGGAETRIYQAYYRDPAPGHCTSATFNFSNGLEARWGY